MSENQTISLNGKTFYNTEYIKHVCPAFFHGCAKSHRLLISKKNISENDYIYATYAPKTLKWKVSNSEVKSAKVLLLKEWVEVNVPGFGNNIKLDLEIAPPLLILKDEEKIKDEDGNIFEIETRGNKTIEGIYFYGKDIEKMLKLESLRQTLNNEHGSYIENTHYKKFIRPNCEKNNEFNNPERIYLTYFGLVKLITYTRKKIPQNFTEWLHMLLGVPFTNIKFLCSETDTIESIRTSINTESIRQYSIERYRVDLYIPEYNLVVECDENNHRGRDKDYENEREKYIKYKLNCHFIRYNPNSDNFDIFKVIRDINMYISEKQKLSHEHNIRELELKLKHEQELRLMEKNMKDELTKILLNLSRDK